MHFIFQKAKILTEKYALSSAMCFSVYTYDQKYLDTENIFNEHAAFALGFFDGVHIGHRDILKRLIHTAKTDGRAAGVFTFDRLNIRTKKLSNNDAFRIQEDSERIFALLDTGCDFVVEFCFSSELRKLSAEAFLDQVNKVFSPSAFITGENFHFGRNREGSTRTLREFGLKNNIKIESAKQIKDAHGTVSSTRIRKLIREGRVKEASALLTLPFSVKGRVVKGEGLGEKLGSPTVNIEFPKEKIMPLYGVYISRCKIGEKFYESISNFGIRPTVNSSSEIPRLETYVYGLSSDIYGEEVEVFFIDFIRGEKKFKNKSELTHRINRDIKSAFDYHRSEEVLRPVFSVSGIDYYELSSVRFKTSYLKIIFRLPAEKKKNSERALISRMLLQMSEDYPDRRKFNMVRDSLYGADISYSPRRVGKFQEIEFSLSSVTYAPDGKAVFTEASELLISSILRPCFDERGNFDEKLFEIERKNLISELKAEQQDKLKYAYDRSMSLLFKDAPEGLSAEGEASVLEKIKIEDLRKSYDEMMRCSEIYVFSATESSTKFRSKLFDSLKKFNDRRNASDLRTNRNKACFASAPEIEILPEVEEKSDIEQARLQIYWKGLPPFSLMDGQTVNVFNSLFGADMHSLLFENVREKNGFAYSVFSLPLAYISLVTVILGIKPEYADRAAEECRRQLSNIADMKFSKRQFESSVMSVKNKVLSLSDQLSAKLSYQIQALFKDSPLESEEAVKELQNIKPEDMADLAGGLSEVFTYKLMPEK